MVSYTYDDLRSEYLDLWEKSQVNPERISEVDKIVDGIMAADAWSQYQAVEKEIGVPAHVVGFIHVREASQNFHCHLHNGDPLSGRTVHVPEGRPPAPAEPPFTWQASAIDALTFDGLDKWRDWSAPGICFVLEEYNGFGYREYHHINSPYLWGFTTAYVGGLYSADGQWDPTAVNENPGCIAMLRRMVDRKLITLPDQPAAAADQPAATAEPSSPPSPGIAETIASFETISVTLQTQLKDAGYYNGNLDGDWWTLSRRALQRFKSDHPRR